MLTMKADAVELAFQLAFGFLIFKGIHRILKYRSLEQALWSAVIACALIPVWSMFGASVSIPYYAAFSVGWCVSAELSFRRKHKDQV